MLHRRAREAMSRSVTGALTRDEIARFESFPPEVKVSRNDWMSILLDLVDMGMLEIAPNRDKDPRFTLPTLVSE